MKQKSSIFFLFSIFFVSYNSFTTIEKKNKKQQFDISNYRFYPIENKPSQHYTFFQKLFSRNFSTTQTTALIPKIIHIIWLGSPPSDQVFNCYESFKKFHPDWKIKLWTDKDLPYIQLRNNLFFAITENYGQKSDILRYELLYKYGGVYVDSDMLCLKSLDTLHTNYEFYAGMLSPGGLGIGIIGSIPRHPILKKTIGGIKFNLNLIRQCSNFQKKNTNNFILNTTGNYHFERCFMKTCQKIPNDRIIIFPTTFFYPSPASLRNQPIIKQLQCIQAESYTLHRWDTSWQVKTISSFIHQLYRLKTILNELTILLKKENHDIINKTIS